MQNHTKHLRYRNFDRIRHSDSFLAFLSQQAVRLTGTGAGTGFVAVNASNSLTIATHPYVDGDGPFVLANSGGALPAELDTTTLYWVRSVDANTVGLYLTQEDAEANTNGVSFTDDGTGTHTILAAADALTIFEALQGGSTAAQIVALTDIDNL
jgi:hypothetical protein